MWVPEPRWFLWFSSSWTLRCLRAGNFGTAQEYKVPKLGRLNLAQIDFPRMSLHKMQDVFFLESVKVVTVSIVTVRSL